MASLLSCANRANQNFIKCINEECEQLNVICFFVADLCFVKDVIGQCQCTSMYGCYHCMLKRVKAWNGLQY